MPGQNYTESIYKAIEKSSIMVVIFSHNINNSVHARTEIERAFNFQKIIIPFRIEDFEPSQEIHYLIGNRQWFDALNQPLDTSIDKLAQTIARFTHDKIKKIKIKKVAFSIHNTSICSFTSDVVIVWYNQDIMAGIDKMVLEHMRKNGVDILFNLSQSTDFLLVPSKGTINSRFVLFMNVKAQQSQNCGEIREYIRRAVKILSEESILIKHISITLQGLIYGFDEIEILKAELAGLSDAVGARQFPKHLETISLIENDTARFDRLKNALHTLLPEGYIQGNPEEVIEKNDQKVLSSRFDRVKKALYTFLPNGGNHGIAECPQEIGKSFDTDNIKKNDRTAVTTEFHDVFISYVEEDSNIAVEIAKSLEKTGFSIWYYERDILPGLPYFDQVIKNIDHSKIVMVIISSDSLSSSQVYNEITYAHERGKSFIPILKDISHIEFQNRQPGWRMILGPYTSIRIPEGNVGHIIDKIIQGTRTLLQNKTLLNES